MARLKNLLLFFVLFISFIFSSISVKNTLADDNADCLGAWNLVCCVKDTRGQLAGCNPGEDRYRAYACERKSATVNSCSDVCWVTNGIKGQCLVDCPTNVGPASAGRFPLQECCGSNCTFITPAFVGTTTSPGGSPGGSVPTGPLPTFAPGQTIQQYFQTLSVGGFFSNLVTGFFNSLSSLVVNTSAIPTAVPGGPTPTLSAIATPVPLNPSATACIVPATINIWNTNLNPSFTSQEQGSSKVCSTNSLVSKDSNFYVYRECGTYSSGQSLCYYDCFNITKNQKIDCYGEEAFGVYVGNQPNHPVRTIIRLVNQTSTPIKLVNNTGAGSIIIQKTSFFNSQTVATTAFINEPDIQPIGVFNPTAPDANTLTIDLTNSPVNCSKPLEEISVEVNYTKNFVSEQPIIKTFNCQKNFTGVIEFN